MLYLFLTECEILFIIEFNFRHIEFFLTKTVYLFIYDLKSL